MRIDIYRHRHRRKPKLIFRIGPVTEQTSAPSINRAHQRTKRGKVLAVLQLTDSQDCAIGVAMKDKKGNPVDDSHLLIWGVDNSDLLTITPSDDTRSCKISAVGPLGTALLSAQDADDNIAGTLEVTIVSGAATVVALEPGTPTEQ